MSDGKAPYNPVDAIFRNVGSLVNRGGPGSGHHGHKGRPGQRGGSAPGFGPKDEISKPKDEPVAEETTEKAPMSKDQRRLVKLNQFAEKAMRNRFVSKIIAEAEGDPDKMEFWKDEAFGTEVSKALSFDGHSIMRAFALAFSKAHLTERAAAIRGWLKSEHGDDTSKGEVGELERDGVFFKEAERQLGHPPNRSELDEWVAVALEDFSERSKVDPTKPSLDAAIVHLPAMFRAALEDANWHDRANTVQGWMEETGGYNPYGPPDEPGPRPGPVVMETSYIRRGGPGSGHFGHKGRPGQRGGSAPGYMTSDISGEWDDLYFVAHGAIGTHNFQKASDAMNRMNEILAQMTDKEAKVGLQQEMNRLAQDFNDAKSQSEAKGKPGIQQSKERPDAEKSDFEEFWQATKKQAQAQMSSGNLQAAAASLAALEQQVYQMGDADDTMNLEVELNKLEAEFRNAGGTRKMLQSAYGPGDDWSPAEPAAGIK